MQLSIVEFAKTCIGLEGAHSIELDPNTHPVIALMPDQNGVEDIGGTLRLGSYPCVLDKTSKAYELYGEELIHERHRHRYEVNNDYRSILTEHGMTLSGLSPDGRIVEMIELKGSPLSPCDPGLSPAEIHPDPPHPRFRFVLWCLIYQKNNNNKKPASRRFSSLTIAFLYILRQVFSISSGTFLRSPFLFSPFPFPPFR